MSGARPAFVKLLDFGCFVVLQSAVVPRFQLLLWGAMQAEMVADQLSWARTVKTTPMPENHRSLTSRGLSEDPEKSGKISLKTLKGLPVALSGGMLVPSGIDLCKESAKINKKPPDRPMPFGLKVTEAVAENLPSTAF